MLQNGNHQVTNLPTGKKLEGKGNFHKLHVLFSHWHYHSTPLPKLNLSGWLPSILDRANEETNSGRGFSSMRNTKMTHGLISYSWHLSLCPLTLLWKHEMSGHRLMVPIPWTRLYNIIHQELPCFSLLLPSTVTLKTCLSVRRNFFFLIAHRTFQRRSKFSDKCHVKTASLFHLKFSPSPDILPANFVRHVTSTEVTTGLVKSFFKISGWWTKYVSATFWSTFSFITDDHIWWLTVCVWFSPSWQPSTTQPLTHLGVGKWIRKRGRLVGWDKQSLIINIK